MGRARISYSGGPVSARTATTLTEALRDFIQSLWVNVVTIPRIRSQLPATLFQNNLLIVQQFEAIQPQQLTAALNKL
jgi:hypothetical protein